MARERHRITIEDYASFTGEVLMASSAGRYSRKRLTINVQITDLPTLSYLVTSHERPVYNGTSLTEAICAYNDEP